MKLYFNPEILQSLAREHQEKYATQNPFPHICLDNLLPDEALEKILDEFPSPGKPVWKEYQNYHEGKLETQGEGKVGVFTSWILYQFNSAPFLQFLETLTGITGLIPDPYFHGGGLHQIPRGGKLGIHADFNRNKKLLLDRRVNVLFYLNKDWKEEYGGHLELWDKEMTQCQQKILPLYNRLVVFSSTDFSFHGHPEPLSCPEGMTRKSIALYYYTNGRPAHELQEGKKSTLFMRRPGESVPEGTIFSRDTITGLKDVPGCSEAQKLKQQAMNMWQELKNSESSKVVYKLDKPAEMKNELQFDPFTSVVSADSECLIISSASEDPQILLPELPCRKACRAVKMQMTAPNDSVCQLFYTTDFSPEFSENECVSTNIEKGDNTVFFVIPETFSGSLRIDPGLSKGIYKIRSLEIIE